MDPERGDAPLFHLQDCLADGDLRSDGFSNEVVNVVLTNLELLGELVNALGSQNDVVRGHSADALEKIGRSRPELIARHVNRLKYLALNDPVPMVRWHMAMLLGHLAVDVVQATSLCPILLEMLDDSSVFVRSWVITSLCIICRQTPDTCPDIIEKVADLLRDPSVAIRTRAAKALEILVDDQQPFPKGWIKSLHHTEL